MAFRSIVVSLTAAVATLLSAFVGFGVLTLVIQEGYGLGLTGLDRTGPIETFVPPIAFAILFGLFMDYMVFLMSRIREEHVHGLKTREAVEHGIAAIGRVVVAAAMIMGTVFAAFILTPDRISKEFGLLLAVAILTDALVVKMTLVPAFFTLLGEKTWYMPRWLDKLLPNITIEPPHDGEAPAPVAVPRAGADGSLTERRAEPSGSARLTRRGGRASPARRLRPQGGRNASCDHRDRHDVREAEPGGMPNGSRSPWTTSSGTRTASSSGSRLSGGLPPERRGGTSGNARQSTPAAPVASAVRQATRAPADVRPRRAASRRVRLRAAARRPRATPRRAGAPAPGSCARPRGTAARRARRRKSVSSAASVAAARSRDSTPPPAPCPSTSQPRGDSGRSQVHARRSVRCLDVEHRPRSLPSR